MAGVVVRELINLIGYRVDAASYSRAERGFDRLKRRGAELERTTRNALRPRGADGRFIAAGADRAGQAMQGAGRAVSVVTAEATSLSGVFKRLAAWWAGAWAVRAGQDMLRLASDARETQNLLGVTFGAAGQQEINAWSNNMANKLGRSRDLLREYASEFGAFLKPTVGQGEDLNAMAEAMAQRVVDLASFRNLSEQVALEKMRAGLAGETEPLRSIGVDVSVAALDEFAKSQGLVLKSLDKTQTMALRYRLIMAKTADAHGDASETADEYANTSKALFQVFRDIRTELGERGRPAVLKFMIALRDTGWEALRLMRQSDLLASSIKAAGIAAGAYAVPALVKLAAANKGVLRTMMGLGRGLLIFGALVILVDELNALFSGGRSVVGEYIDEIFGLGTADQFVRDHKAGVEDLVTAWKDAKDTIGPFIDDIGDQIEARMLEPLEEAMRALPYGDKMADTFRRQIDDGLTENESTAFRAALAPFGLGFLVPPATQIAPATQAARGTGGMTRDQILERDRELNLISPGTYLEGRGAPFTRDPYDPRERYPAPYPFAFDPAQGGAPLDMPALPDASAPQGPRGDTGGRGPIRNYRGPVMRPGDDGEPDTGPLVPPFMRDASRALQALPYSGTNAPVEPEIPAPMIYQDPHQTPLAEPMSPPQVSIPAPMMTYPAPAAATPAQTSTTTVHMGDTHVTVQAARGDNTDEVVRKARRAIEADGERKRRRLAAALDGGR